MKPLSRSSFDKNSLNSPEKQGADDVELSKLGALGEQRPNVELDQNEKVTQSAERALPKTKEKRSFFSFVPRLVGRTGIGIAVAGAILGTCLGTPEGRTPQNSVPLDSVRIEAPVGDHIERGTQVIDDLMRVIAPQGGITRTQALESMGHVSFSVRVDRGHLLSTDGGESGLEIKPGTRISAYLSAHGLTFSASPSLTWRAPWVPDANIERLTYDFSTARFTADASGFGPDFLYRDAVESNANEQLVLRLPAAMRQPGYNPFTDPNLEANLQRMIDLLASTSDPSTGRARERDLAQVSAPSLTFDVTVPNEMMIPLPGESGQRAWVDAGTQMNVSLSTEGPINGPRLSSLRISFNQPITIGTGENKPRGFGYMELNAFNLAPNGQITLDYELGPEHAIDGARGLFLLLAIAAEPRLAANPNVGNMERTRMERMRADIQAQIDSGVEPKLADIIRQNNDLLPGLPLMQFFGIQ